jgi:hypothetical protein
MKSSFYGAIAIASLLQLTTGIAWGQESTEFMPLVEEFSFESNAVDLIAQEAPDPVPVPVPEPESPRRGSSLHRQSGSEQRFRPQRVPLRSNSIQRQQQAPAASPGISIMNPSGYGSSWGRAGVGVGLQERTRFTEDADGVMGLGIGFGNPAKAVGVGLGITVTDLWEQPFADGTISLKLHRRLPYDMSVGAGVQGLLRWGTTDGGRSIYGVMTKRFIFDRDPSQLFNQLHVSVGVGSGQFRSEDNINNDEGSVGVFGSMALRVNQPVSAIAEWTGQDMTVGLSIAPFRNIPVVISPAVTDITGTAGDGTRFILGIGYGFSFPTNF